MRGHIPAPGGRQAVPTIRRTGDTGNRTQVLAFHKLKAYHHRHQYTVWLSCMLFRFNLCACKSDFLVAKYQANPWYSYSPCFSYDFLLVHSSAKTGISPNTSIPRSIAPGSSLRFHSQTRASSVR